MDEPIGWLEAVILGVVQGLTEFLLISSSAHVLIVSQLFGWGDPGEISKLMVGLRQSTGLGTLVTL